MSYRFFQNNVLFGVQKKVYFHLKLLKHITVLALCCLNFLDTVLSIIVGFISFILILVAFTLSHNITLSTIINFN